MPLRKCVLNNILFFLLVISVPFFAVKAFSQEAVVLKLVLNEEDIGEFFMVLAPEGDLWIKREDMDRTRLIKGLGSDFFFNGESFVSLKSIEGVDFTISEEDVSVKVTAKPHLFQGQTISLSYARPYKVIHTKDNSAFLNYGVFYDSQNSSFDVSSELGLTIGEYFATSAFNYLKSDTDEKGVRLLTFVRTDDMEKMRTFTFGDLAASSGIMGGTVIAGGLHLSRNFSTDPYFLKYPSLDLSGALLTPSEVEIWTDGFLTRRETLLPGEFLLKDIPVNVGYGSADIVIRDIYGTKKVITRPFFYSDRLLKKGLHEYSYTMGFIRKDIGEKSFSYADPAIAAFHNYGFSEMFRGGYALEASRELINAGPAASFLISDAGVVDAAVSFSNSGGKGGFGGFAGYFFKSRRVNASLSVKGLTKDFSNLTLKPSDDRPSLQFTAAAGYSSKYIGSISVGYSKSRMHTGKDTFSSTVSYNRVLMKWATLFLNATRNGTEGGKNENEIFLGLHVYLGKDMSGSISYTGREEDNIKKASIQKNLPTSGGFGFNAQAESFGNDSTNTRGDVQYQNGYGVYNAGYRDIGSEGNYTLSLAGGAGYIGGKAFLSRPVTDSFARVKVGGLPDVRVYYFGNEAGRTDKNGDVIIPLLRSFHDNKIDIEKQDIPIDYSIPALYQYVSPPFRGGSLVDFDIKKLQGFGGNIYLMVEGRKLPVEFSVISVTLNDGTVLEGLVGKGGEFYIENVPAGKHPAKLDYKGKECVFDMIIPDSEDVWVDIGEILCEVR